MGHPATELVTGLDLVERQVQAAVEAGSTPRTRDEAS